MLEKEDPRDRENKISRDIGQIFGSHLHSIEEWWKKYKDSLEDYLRNPLSISAEAAGELNKIFATTYINLNNLSIVYDIPRDSAVFNEVYQKYVRSRDLSGNLQLATLAVALEQPALAIPAIHTARAQVRELFPGSDFEDFNELVKEQLMQTWVCFVADHLREPLELLIMRRPK